jgi:hypothetical protein
MGPVDEALGWASAIGIAQGWFSPPGGNPPEPEPVQPWLLGVAEGGELMAALVMKLEQEHCMAWGVVNEGSTDMNVMNAKFLQLMKEAEGKAQVDWQLVKLQARRGRQLWADSDLVLEEDPEDEEVPEVSTPASRRACDMPPRPEAKTRQRPTGPPRAEKVHSKPAKEATPRKRGRALTQEEVGGTDSEVERLTGGKEKGKRCKHTEGGESKRGSTLGSRLRAISSRDSK